MAPKSGAKLGAGLTCESLTFYLRTQLNIVYLTQAQLQVLYKFVQFCIGRENIFPEDDITSSNKNDNNDGNLFKHYAK